MINISSRSYSEESKSNRQRINVEENKAIQNDYQNSEL